MTDSSSNSDTPLPAPTELEQAALTWFSRCQRGLSVTQENEFQDWLAADPRHAALFNELDGTWALLGRTLKVAPPQTVGRSASLWRRRAVRLGLSMAALIAFAATYFVWWRPDHYSGESSTTIGVVRTFGLPDGSSIALNTDSSFSAAFTPAERRIRLLRGEAHFTVSKNPARPFIVEAGGVAVRAVGTAFKVHLEEKAVEVLVTEGKVRVNEAVSGKSLIARPAAADEEALHALGDTVLTSGQKVVVSLPAPVVKAESRFTETAATTVSAEQIKRELAWQDRRLEFELAPLGEIVAEFNRYNAHKLVIIDAALAEKRFGGSFKADDEAGFVRMLRENFGVTVYETETATILRAGP